MNAKDPRELAKKFIFQAENLQNESSGPKDDANKNKQRGRPKKEERKKRKKRIYALCTYENAKRFQEFCNEMDVSASSVLDAYINKILRTGEF